MAYFGSQPNDEFSAGVSHLANTGRANDFSHTLGDAGLDQTSARWAATTPRAVLASAMRAGSQDDGSYERYQREQDGYAPGSMEQFQDQLSGGTNDNAS